MIKTFRNTYSTRRGEMDHFSARNPPFKRSTNNDVLQILPDGDVVFRNDFMLLIIGIMQV